MRYVIRQVFCVLGGLMFILFIANLIAYLLSSVPFVLLAVVAVCGMSVLIVGFSRT